MNYLWYCIAVVGGAVIGFFVCALLNASKDRAVFTVDNVVKWLMCQMDENDMDKKLYLIVRKVYGGKRHIHKNREKVAT